MDKAVGRIVLAGSENVASRIDRITAIRKATTDASIEVIRASSADAASNLDEISDLKARALNFALKDNILRQGNRESIARIAVSELEHNPGTEDAGDEIDDDSLNDFSDLAGRKSKEDFRMLWGKILAAKIRKPGEFGLKSLHSLALIDSRDAATIHSVLSMTINSHFVFGQNEQHYNLAPFLALADLGVLFAGGAGFAVGFDFSADTPSYFNLGTRLLMVESPIAQTLRVPAFPLTEFGKDLYRVIDLRPDGEPYDSRFVDFLRQRDFRLSIANIIGRHDTPTLEHSQFVAI